MRTISTLLFALFLSLSANAGMIYIPANSTDNAKAGKISSANMLGRLDAKNLSFINSGKSAGNDRNQNDSGPKGISENGAAGS